MVKSSVSSHAQLNRDKLADAMRIFGRTLILRVVTRSIDDFGQLSNLTTADTTFTGDLQFGLDLDQRYIQSGIIEVGQGVLYLHPTELSSLPIPQDQIVDGNAVWEILNQIESPELGGDVTFYSYSVKRRPNSSDV